MGKIKGWKKVKNDHYEWIGKLVRYSYAGSEHKPKVDIIKDRFDKWAVFWNGKSGYVRSQSFDNKKEATDYAIKYMRSHPNG